jgi:hypothetical protein
MMRRNFPEDIHDPELAELAASYPQVEVLEITPFDDLTKRELIKLAKDFGVLNAANKSKAALVATLENERGV